MPKPIPATSRARYRQGGQQSAHQQRFAHLIRRLAPTDLGARALWRTLDEDDGGILLEVTRWVAAMMSLGWVLGANAFVGGLGASHSLQRLVSVLFTTPLLRVLLSFLHRPMGVAGHRIFLLETTAGRFTSIRRPTIFNHSGEVIGLTTEVGIGSIVRVHGEDRTIHAVQIIELHVINPFQDT